jgi:hypothetical protein
VVTGSFDLLVTLAEKGSDSAYQKQISSRAETLQYLFDKHFVPRNSTCSAANVCKRLKMFAIVFYSTIEFLIIWKPQDGISKMEDAIGNMLDFGFFLTLTVAIFSIIGIGCISLGAYAVLRNDSQKREVGKNEIQNRRLIR